MFSFYKKNLQNRTRIKRLFFQVLEIIDASPNPIGNIELKYRYLLIGSGVIFEVFCLRYKKIMKVAVGGSAVTVECMHITGFASSSGDPGDETKPL